MLSCADLQPYGLEPAFLAADTQSCVAVRGASGSGKSLLLRAIADLDAVVGQCILNGIERGDMGAPQWRQMVAYVPAEPGWWKPIAGDNFKVPTEQRVLDCLTSLGLPEDIMGRSIETLSTGERSRLALVRALEQGPKVLLLDEPSSALDEAATQQMEAVIKAFIANQGIVILVSHDQQQIKRLADEVYEIQHSRLVLLGSGESS